MSRGFFWVSYYFEMTLIRNFDFFSSPNWQPAEEARAAEVSSLAF